MSELSERIYNNFKKNGGIEFINDNRGCIFKGYSPVFNKEGKIYDEYKKQIINLKNKVRIIDKFYILEDGRFDFSLELQRYAAIFTEIEYLAQLRPMSPINRITTYQELENKKIENCEGNNCDMYVNLNEEQYKRLLELKNLCQ